MSFVKGAMIGAVIGSAVMMISGDNINNIMKKGKREIKKIRRKYGM